MCGIAGIVTNEIEVDVPDVLRTTMRSLAHRGPDSCGCQTRTAGNWRIGLAHTRLAILDLSEAGHQPMTSPCGRSCLTFNGEVYNFKELKQELTQAGPFRSQTDTEVILKAVETWGVNAFKKLRGMFAFAQWDQRTRSLLLARDQLGIKPLYYYCTPRLFLFASEIRALLSTGLVPRKLSRHGLNTFLQTGSVTAPETIIDGVFSLLPGAFANLNCTADTLTLRQATYCDDIFRPPAGPARDRREAAEELCAVLKESVRLHLVSDVPLGLFLSGGIDSSALVALVSKVSGERPKTFTVIFPELKYSEQEQARVVAERFGTDHRNVMLTQHDLARMLPEGLRALDQPTVDGMNTYVISKAVKEAGITVALSGLGGDEIFAGYSSFRRARRVASVRLIPDAIRAKTSRIGGALLGGSVARRKAWELLRSDCSPKAVYSLSRRLFAADEIHNLTGDGLVKESVCEQWYPEDPVTAISWMEIQGYMANTLLRDTDFMSMAHALEVRVPLVDSDVIRFVLGLPGKWKLDSRRPKPLLLEALGQELPEEVWRRPKNGFELPFASWMRSALKPELEEAFGHTEGFRTIGIEPCAAGQVWDSFQRTPSKERWSRTWALFAVQRWCSLNRVGV